ncbi:MAG TPA: methyltransferase regulatory domain-containing protein [Tepidisphaeraceae bacterium]|nr:methyltransferase regulatory domain-containing protein [Tepidisphaeraceae bacterium]
MEGQSISPDDVRAGEARGDVINSYDALPYSVSAFPQTRPDHLAAIGRLFGLNPPRPDGCRVLELGCAAGGNLLPMAAASPGSRFVGIELSHRQAADGQAAAREMGLNNIDIRGMSILDVTPELGEFDYILAHGVYSWVPPAVQEKILDICRRNLSTSGIAYISYNTYPGWHARGAVREMLWYHTQRYADPVERTREARLFLEFLAGSPLEPGDGYSTLLRQEMALLQAVPDSYLLHEHLDDFNDPLYFHQFAERAADHGLQYLAEAHVGSMMVSRFGPAVEAKLREIAPDLLQMEQYMDFVRNRMFRQTLLCHAGLELDHALRPEAVRGFYIASALKPVSSSPDLGVGKAEAFGEGTVTLSTADPLMKAAMLHLAAKWPLPVSFDALVAAAGARFSSPAGDPASHDKAGPPTSDDIQALAVRLLNCHASSLVEFSVAPPAFITHVSERPIASPYARLRARAGELVTNARLETITMGEPSRLVLCSLDGRHDRESLIGIIGDWLAARPAPPNTTAATGGAAPTTGNNPRTHTDRATRFVGEVLQGFAESALLIE